MALTLTVTHITVLRWLAAEDVESDRIDIYVKGRVRSRSYLDVLRELEAADYASSTPAAVPVRGRRRQRVSWDLTDAGDELLATTPKLVHLLCSETVADFRRGWDYQGDAVEHVTGTGRSTCRCCGCKIAKGSPAIAGYYDFIGDGSRTATKVYIHETCPVADGSC